MAAKKPSNKRKAKSVLTEQLAKKSAERSEFPIVGVGASAGGLEAFTQLFKHLPADSGMAFVLIQHLAPAHESMLTSLLSKSISMPVSEVKDGMIVRPDNVYIIPPDKEMLIFHGVLHLMPREEVKGQYMPVDSFLRSLAQDRRSNAIAVILSGSGSDGSMGIRAVKGEGGIVFAQDETAKYEGMPKSAIDTGSVDFVLPPDKIAVELLRIRQHPYLVSVRRGEPVQIMPAEEKDLNKIFIMLRSAKGVDFTSYKRSTIMRRVTRRMLLQKIEGMEEYVAYLKENPSEIETLYQDVLINVTSFFREPEAFEALKRSIFPHIVNKASVDAPVRVWVPACSTGEEAYSIAIALIEYMDDNKISRSVQLFATDIDELAVEKARKGIYPENISRDVSPARLRRFFEKTGGGYVINKFVREMCIFARQNMVKDPPFSKIDLVSCRNVLIYFSQELQKKAVRILFYALNPRGFLMIGPSETVGEFAGLFSMVDKKHSVYAKKAEQPTLRIEQSSETLPLAPFLGKEVIGVVKPAPALSDIQKEADTIVLAKYSPTGFVVSETLKILQFRGDTGPYLRPAPGDASLDLLKMVSEDLVVELRTALHQAKKADVPVRKERHKVKEGKRIKYINIDVVPFKASPSGDRCFLVLFEDVGAGLKPAQPRKGDSRITPATDETLQLRQELAESKMHLNTVTQEYEAANEELRALNEELQSSNEEMQSINEEMETAKEELQSTNEELTTVNDELQSRNEETTQLNNDLFNVLRGVEIPIIILGNELQIRRFNDAAARLLNIIPTDTGRPLSNIRTNINIPDLEQLVLAVINTLAVKVKEAQDVEGRWYSMTIRPYKTVDNRIDGVLMTLVDIDDIKRSFLKIKAAYDYATAIVETVREPLVVLAPDLRVITANRSFYENFLETPEETENKFIFDLGDRQWNSPELRDLLEKVLPEDKAFSGFEIELELPNIGRRVMLLNARKVYLEEPYFKTALNITEHFDSLILLAIEDITERKLAEGALRESEQRYRSLFDNMLNGFAYCKMLFEDGRPQDFIYLEVNNAFEKLTGLKNVVGKKVSEVIPGIRESYPELFEIYGRVALTGRPESFEIYLEPLALWLFVSVYSTEKGYFVAVFDNITERKRAESLTQARLRMLSMSTSASVSRDETLQMMLDEIEKQTGSTIGFYHFLEADQETLSLQAWSTNTLRNMCTAEGKGSHYNISQAGVWVDCVHERAPVIHNDYASLAHRRGLPPGHASVKREMVVPILRGSRIVAIIGFGNKPTDYNATDVGIVQSLGQLSWEIFERKRAEEALQVSSDRYRSYIDVTGALGWTTDADGEVVEDIPSWRTYTGQTYEEVEGQGWSKALHPDDLENTLQVWEKAVAEKSDYEVEYRVRRHDGVYRNFMVRGMPVLEEDGSVREWVGTCIDITGRKESEETLKALNRELEGAHSELEAAYREMESFSYSVSHDLRAPLRIIDGFSDILLKDHSAKLDDAGRDLLTLIQGNAKRMGQLIMAMLDLAKTGRQEISIDEIDMEKAATLISADLKAMFPERNININITELPPAHGDITLIRQVFTNLLSNAVKFTKDRDTAAIEVGGRREESENVYYVKDNGAGFDMEYADKLFKVFQRLHNLKEFKGVGIGLSIVDRIIRRHGGRVWAEGKPEEGATFYFTLPGKGE